MPHGVQLRYYEKLDLNKKDASQTFKAITRTKREHVADGKGVIKDKGPDLTKYSTDINANRP